MKNVSLWLLAFGCSILEAEPLFIRDDEARREAASEASGIYRALMNRGESKDILIVRLNKSSFSKEKVEVDLPSTSRAQFSFERNGDRWEGRGKNFSRFTLREEGGLFSGQIFHAGKSYRIVPLKENISVLYRVNEDGFTCGASEVHPSGPSSDRGNHVH